MAAHDETDHAFDKAYWEQHWSQGRTGSMATSPANPYVGPGTAGLIPTTALDAGCGAGAEAIWLAQAGWRVTAADISATALARAAERAATVDVPGTIDWVEADLSLWQPATSFDLVMTHYAHPAMPQLDFYERAASWVAPGGTLLIVGHLHSHDHAPGHHGEVHGPEDGGHHPPAEATATAAAITARLAAPRWRIVSAEEHRRTLEVPGGGVVELHDVVVRAERSTTAA